jgi:hypothetical protein
MEYTSAGCIFTNGTHILGGYQPNKQAPCISGIGGKREGCEEFVQTAMREMLEEMFGIYARPDFVTALMAIPYDRLLISGDYISLIYSFSSLEKILVELVRLNAVSSMYNEIPLTLNDLILKRLGGVDSEISHLCLLPVVKHPRGTPYIENCFMKDIIGLLPKAPRG